MGQDDWKARRGGSSSWTPHLLLLFPLPPPCLISSDLQRRLWGLPGLGAACLGCSGSEGRGKLPHPPPPAGVQDCEGPDMRRWQGQALELELTGSCAEA